MIRAECATCVWAAFTVSTASRRIEVMGCYRTVVLGRCKEAGK